MPSLKQQHQRMKMMMKVKSVVDKGQKMAKGKKSSKDKKDKNPPPTSYVKSNSKDKKDQKPPPTPYKKGKMRRQWGSFSGNQEQGKESRFKKLTRRTSFSGIFGKKQQSGEDDETQIEDKAEESVTEVEEKKISNMNDYLDMFAMKKKKKTKGGQGSGERSSDDLDTSERSIDSTYSAFSANTTYSMQSVCHSQSFRKNVPIGEGKTYNIEIISCRDLLIADTTASDPYIKVKLGKEILHSTKYIKQTLNPKFGPEHDNAFILETSTEEIEACGGLRFKIKDYDLVGADDDLGEVIVSAEKIATMTGEPEEFKIKPPKKEWMSSAGFLTFSCKRADGPDVGESIVTTSTNMVDDQNQPEGRDVDDDCEQSVHSVLSDNSAQSPLPSQSFDSTIPDEILNYMVEIVSCRDLIVADSTGASDPYIKVRLGKDHIHDTKYIKQTINPQYGPEHNNIFILQCSTEDLDDAGGLHFKIKDHDMIGHDDDLGDVMVSAQQLAEMTGEPAEFKIKPPENESSAGFLTIKCKPATPADILKHGNSQGSSGIFGKKRKSPRKALSSTRSIGTTGSHDCNQSVESGSSGIGASSAHRAKSIDNILPDDGKLRLKVRIVSCRDLIIADAAASDPYVKVRLGKSYIHSTKYIKQTLNPQYGPEHDNIFILQASKEEIDAAGGLRFKIKDFDLVGTDDDLGDVKVSTQKLLEMTGESVELKIDPPKNHSSAGFLTISCKPATVADIEKYGDIQGTAHHGVGGALLHGAGAIGGGVKCVAKTAGGGVLAVGGGVVGVAGTMAGGGVSIVGGGVSVVGQSVAKVGCLIEGDGSKSNVIVGALAKGVKKIGNTVADTGNIVSDAGNVVSDVAMVVTDKTSFGEEEYDENGERKKKGLNKLVNTVKSSIDVANPQNLAEKAGLISAEEKKDETEEEEEEEEEEPVEPMVIETVPSHLLLSKSSVVFKAIIRGDDLSHTIELLEEAMSENPNIEWFEFYNLGLSESSEDIKLGKTLVKYPKITKICLHDIHVLCSCNVNPPFFEYLSDLPALEDLEIRMKDKHELPYPFLTSFLETSPVKSLVLWNVLFDFGRLKLVYEAFVANRRIERFELWQSDAGNDVKFAELTGNMLKFNTTLEKLVLSHIELRGEHCHLLADALQKNYTLKELALINVLDAEKAMGALLAMTNKKLQSLCVTFEESDYEGRLELYEWLQKNSIMRKCKEIADATAKANQKGWCSIL